MQYAIPVNVLQSSQRHRHPALHIRILDDESFIPDDSLQVGTEELENEVDVLLHGENIE